MKLDLGAGPNKREGFIGVDALQFDGKVDVVCDLVALQDAGQAWKSSAKPKDNGYSTFVRWPWENDSVEEVFSSHFVEHLTGYERIFFFNELHRVMKKGAKALIVTPNWSHACAYGDPTHMWPPMSAWYPLYLNKGWRDTNAPHDNNLYTCDFDWGAGHTVDPAVAARNQEYQLFAANHYTNAMRDLHVMLTKR